MPLEMRLSEKKLEAVVETRHRVVTFGGMLVGAPVQGNAFWVVGILATTRELKAIWQPQTSRNFLSVSQHVQGTRGLMLTAVSAGHIAVPSLCHRI